MDQERYGEIVNYDLDSKSETTPCDVKKKSASSVASIQSSEIVENQSSINNFASPTPEKTIQSSRSKNTGTGLSLKAVKQLSRYYQDEDHAIEDEAVELLDDFSEDEEAEHTPGKTEDEELEVPDKYKIVAELFDRIDTSVRLLNLRKKLPTFQNICTVVEALTKRKLSYGHLAQMKHLLPEAIRIEKILIHDEKTLCMVPDMKVELLLDVIEASSGQSPFMALRRVFRLRLVEFSNSHTEDSDIPLALLPEPFTQRIDTVHSRSLPTGSAVDSYTAPVDLVESESLLASSTLSHSVRRHFSQKLNALETEETELLPPLSNPLPGNSCDQTVVDIKSSQEEECLSLASKSKAVGSPAALIFSPRCSISSTVCESSPVKALSLENPLILETPAQSTPPKRTLPSSDDKINTETKILSHVAAKRSLDFALLRDDGSALGSIADKSEQPMDNRFKTVSKKNVFPEVGFTASPPLSEKVEQKTGARMSHTSLIKHRHMLDFVNMIHNIFLSVNCSLITKQELLQKIITHNLDIVETREAEEQLELLEELVPDWICQKPVPGGDLFYSIRKVSDLESIRARLADAV